MSSRSRAGGLPSGPGPRSRSVARTRDDDRSRYDDDSDGGASSRSSTRQVRPQKSMTSMNQSRSDARPPPMPSSRSRRPTYDSESRSNSGTNRSSDTSTTSSGSSFLDRMKQTAGYASSRTSFEDDEPDNKRSARSTRNKPSRGDSPPPENETETHGDTLWSRIATTASSLSVNVGKAWATNITTFAGEETPVGQESRLTRAMKAYHLEKARDPSDLPAWLFSSEERRRPEPEQPSRSRRRKDDYDDGDYEVVEKTRAEPPPSRGLRDIYEAAAASTSSTRTSTPSARSTRGGRNYADDSPQPSRATDRLKALRDAKRGAVNPAVRDEERVRDAPRAEPEPEAPPPRRRVGLPSGPVSRR